jgi:glycosyltransferase involved in cell wall biosynthesis
LKKKKLLVDAHTFDENHQGIRTFLKGLYSFINVDSRELEIILVANNLENLKKEFKHQKDFKYIKLKSKNKYIRLAYEIPRLIKKHHINYAHFNYYLPLFLSKKCQYIVTIHDVLFIDFPQYFPLKLRIINTFMYRRSALKAQLLTTVSTYSERQIKKHFKTGNKPILVLPNAVSENYLEEHNKDEDRDYIFNNYGIKNYILYVSRIEPRKNHLILIEVYKDLKLWEKGLKIVFIGKENFENRDLNFAIENINKNTRGDVIKLEGIGDIELVKFYNASSLAVFLSLCEGFGIPPIESAALKTPTICANNTAMKDFTFFDDYLINSNSKRKLQEKILDILDNQNDFKNSQKMALISQNIKQKYNWINTAAILAEAISKKQY